MKNNYLGMVREYQHYSYKDNYSVVDLSGSPDLEMIAAAYGMRFQRVFDMSNAASEIDAFLSGDESVLMECIVDPYDLTK